MIRSGKQMYGKRRLRLQPHTDHAHAARLKKFEQTRAERRGFREISIFKDGVVL